MSTADLIACSPSLSLVADAAASAGHYPRDACRLTAQM
jgi:hypothetical protein